MIRDHRAQAEHERRLSTSVVDAMAEAGLWRLGTPRSLDGLEVHPLTCARVVEEVAQADSETGSLLDSPRGPKYIHRSPS
jgi:alkylation response protein AidB-like acyl-CoA dehydrogenase